MIKRRVLSVCLILLLIGGLYLGTFEEYAFKFQAKPKEPVTSLEQLEPVKESTKVKINDLSKAYNLLLEKGEVGFFDCYPVDVSFLHWLTDAFGEDVVMDLAYRLYEGYHDIGLWYLETGNSMHVLWLSYCRAHEISTYYLNNVKWLAEGEDRAVTIDFTGDINLADDWYTMEAVRNRENGIYDCLSKGVINELQGADLSVVNNEFVFSDRGTPLSGKTYTFRANSANIGYLDAFGADLANLANNHAYDFAEEGLFDTISILNHHGIDTMGAGANLSEASVIHYYIANGKKIAIVSATEIERYSNYTKAADETTPGVFKCLDSEYFCKIITKAKENSDYVIANIHWGTEGKYQYSNREYMLADKVVDAGADMIIGGHPHRMQGLEYVDDVPCLFSMGNFWFSTGTLYTTIAQVQIDTNGQLALRLIPCIQQNLTTSIIDGEGQKAFYQFVADYSKDVVIDSEGFVYNTKLGQNEELKVDGNYISGSQYAVYDSGVDLEGRPIDDVGNLK